MTHRPPDLACAVTPHPGPSPRGGAASGPGRAPPRSTSTTRILQEAERWRRSSASTWGRPTPSSPSWKAASPRSSPTKRAAAPRRRSSRSRRTATSSSGSRPGARPSPTPRTRSTRPSGSSAAEFDEVERRAQAGAVQASRGANGDGAQFEAARQGLSAARDQRSGADEAQEGGRGLPRREGQGGGHHRPGLLQRRPAPGHQGRRPDRRPRGQAHRQRADRGRPGLRPQTGAASTTRTDRGLRPRRRDVRHLDPRGRRETWSRSSRPTATPHLGGDDFDDRVIAVAARGVPQGHRASTSARTSS